MSAFQWVIVREIITLKLILNDRLSVKKKCAFAWAVCKAISMSKGHLFPRLAEAHWGGSASRHRF